MKQFLLLFTVFWMLLRPLWPVVEYAVNYNYIATVLCENRDAPEMQCNGKCYLSKMLAKQKKQQDKNPFETYSLQGEQLPIILLEIRDMRFSMIRVGDDDSSPENCSANLHESLFVFELIQPPEV